MKPNSGFKHEFPMRFSLKSRNVTLRPLTIADRQSLITFARSLPADDLLFLERDITQDAEVDWWLGQAAAGTLFTIVAWEQDAVIGYATFDRGSVRWTRHVAELRVVVGPTARGMGLGRLLLELVFEVALAEGVKKVVARMTPTQAAALTLFKRLGFEDEAVLREHAVSANGATHDLLVLSFRTRLHPEQRCDVCGVQVLSALVLDRAKLCSQCYEQRYQELGAGA
jgi:L-amino acid N-acyltransferase YncA